MDPGDALVDVVDPDGEVLEVRTRREVRAGRLRHKAVYIAVVSSDGRLLVHKRSDAKDVLPGAWDVVAGGLLDAGEPWDAAARRELAEELGIDAEPVELGRGSWEDLVVGRVYLVRSDGPFTFADGEVVAARWVDRDGLAELLANETVCPDSVELALPFVRHLVR